MSHVSAARIADFSVGLVSSPAPALDECPANAPQAPASDKPLLFLDFEASSLSEGSWPVEIGFAWIADGRVESGSAIIAPDACWPIDDWSDGAARCHGLTLEQVRAGCPAAQIAADTERFRDFEVVSDNPRWEQCWLDRLRAGREPIRVHSLRLAIARRLSTPATDALALYLFRTDSPHRAGGDAARLAVAWLAATRSEALAA